MDDLRRGGGGVFFACVIFYIPAIMRAFVRSCVCF